MPDRTIEVANLRFDVANHNVEVLDRELAVSDRNDEVLDADVEVLDPRVDVPDRGDEVQNLTVGMYDLDRGVCQGHDGVASAGASSRGPGLMC